MEILNWIVPLISIVAVIVSASLSYSFTKKLQIKAEERKYKRELYQEYLNSINQGILEGSFKKFAEVHNQIPLVGSPNVVAIAMEFHNWIVGQNDKNSRSAKSHNTILRELIMAMRIDIYGSHKINKDYPGIHLSGFKD